MSPELGTENVCEHLLILSSNPFLLIPPRLTTSDFFPFSGSILARFPFSQPCREQGHGTPSLIISYKVLGKYILFLKDTGACSPQSRVHGPFLGILKAVENIPHPSVGSLFLL